MVFEAKFVKALEVNVRGSYGDTCRPGHGPSAAIRPAVAVKAERYGYAEGRAMRTRDLSSSIFES